MKAAFFQVIKPHHKPITTMAINSTGSVLITGSEDATVFVFQMCREDDGFVKLGPIGFVPVPDVVSCFTWYNIPVRKITFICDIYDMRKVSFPVNCRTLR